MEQLTPRSFFITNTVHPEVDDHMVGYSDGSVERVQKYHWLHLIDWYKATWDADNATYWVSSDDPMTDNPVDEADAFGARW